MPLQPVPSQYSPRTFQNIEERLRRLERKPDGTPATGASTYTAEVYQGSLSSPLGSGNADYIRIGDWVWVSAGVGVTSTGTAGNAIVISLPFLPSTTTFGGGVAGMFRFYRSPFDSTYVAAAFVYFDGGKGLAYGLANGLGGVYPLGQTGTPNNPPFVGAVGSFDAVNIALAYWAQP